LSLVVGRKVPASFINPNLLYSAAYSLSIIDIPSAFRDQIFALVAEISQLCMDLRNEAFLEELLPGVVTWKSKELLGHAKLRLREHEEALRIFTELQEEKPDLSGLDYWIIETYIDMGSEDSIQKALELLLPLLQESQDPDPWILAASACLALESPQDAKMFWENAIMRVKIGFHAHHRIRMVNSVECMFRLLEGDPQAGKGVYGVLGAIVSRRPLQSNTPVPKFIIQQVLEQFIQRNRFDLIEPLLEPRAEQILPGIISVVSETAELLGVEVFDDGQRAPIFIHTSDPATIKNIFSNHPNFYCVDDFQYHHKLCDALWKSDEGEEEDFFDDTFSWLDDDDLWEETHIEDDILLESIEKSLTHIVSSIVPEKKHFVCISKDNARYFDILSKIYPRAKLINFISDPRGYVLSKEPQSEEDAKSNVLSWAQELSSVRSHCERLEKNYFELTTPFLKKYSAEELSRLFSFLGQTWEEEVLNALNETPFDTSFDDLEQSYLAIVNTELGPIMKALGFQE